MTNLFLVAIGGAFGASGRYLVGVAIARQFGSGFPWGTICVNVIGSFLIGVAVAYLGEGYASWKLFLMTGVLGGFTTFSTFSLDFIMLIERGAFFGAFTYGFGSVCMSLLALVAGLMLVRTLI